jgi:NAD(P)-dependent dehydrogenase (short-subunit alcohol dehydrogenase family)
MSIYGAIKAAFHGMVRAMVQDVKGTGIRINTLSPGAVDTPSLRRAIAKAAGEDMADAIVESIGQRSPSGRIGKASEIAKVAAFLASDASSYVNGVELFVDGGETSLTHRLTPGGPRRPVDAHGWALGGALHHHSPLLAA